MNECRSQSYPNTNSLLTYSPQLQPERNRRLSTDYVVSAFSPVLSSFCEILQNQKITFIYTDIHTHPWMPTLQVCKVLANLLLQVSYICSKHPATPSSASILEICQPTPIRKMTIKGDMKSTSVGISKSPEII